MRKLLQLSLLLTFLLSIPAVAAYGQVAKLSAEKAGKIGVPAGQIAFIKNDDLWMMNWDGSNQKKVVTAGNVDGKISWSPDGSKIAFVRKGSVDLKGPDYLGGMHKVYDIFIGYVDSAGINTNWWRRITTELGGTYPEWRPDGRIAFTNDVNANKVNAELPNYQTCFMDDEGGGQQILKQDWQNPQYMEIMPTLSPDSLFACVVFKGVNQIGTVICPLNIKGFTEEVLRDKCKIIGGATAPAWSPDGKWIAYIIKEMNKQAIYITNRDLTENYIVYKPAMGQVLQTYPLSWSPDSKWLTFATGDGAVWVIDITGNGLKQIVGPGLNSAPAWSKK